MNSTVTHRVTWDGDHPTFHCDGGQDAPCHNFPDCECDFWDMSGHEHHPDVPQPHCWKLTWLEIEPLDTYYDGGTGTGDVAPRFDGEIETEFEGDGLLWCYADTARVEAAFAAVSQ